MTTPTGRLAWGQAGVYDAIDDRAVIAAVTRNRTGLVWPSVVTPAAGLTMVVAGGWMGVAACGDGTSAVVGGRLDSLVTVNPGPPTGSREDLIWCDVEPDEGTWELHTIPASQAAGRPGIAICYLTVPANATLASQMTIRPADAELERRLTGHEQRQDVRTFTQTTWAGAATVATAYNCLIEPGQWYRCRFDASSPLVRTGSLEGRIGVGFRAAGAPDPTAELLRASVINYPRYEVATHADVEHIFRHPVTAAPIRRDYVGRIWSAGAATYEVQRITNQGPGLEITVEDIGS
jgi:hypothetical protein